jgi:hypothetical protein
VECDFLLAGCDFNWDIPGCSILGFLGTLQAARKKGEEKRRGKRSVKKFSDLLPPSYWAALKEKEFFNERRGVGLTIMRR